MVGGPARAEDPAAWFDKNEAEMVDLYRHLHAHPELSYKEVATAARIAEEWKKAGAVVTTGVGKLGVVGVMKNGPGPTVLVRTDLDALPVTEATGLPFASKATSPDDAGVPVGVMHACGHDIHMASLVATARWLNENKTRWSGTVLLIGQPAEEKIGGAKEMLADGLYTRFPKPDYAIALHVAHDLEAGKVAYTSGPAMASSTSVDILVKGKGGHGAMPQNTVDPIALAALLVLDLQTIVSREVNPIHPAVVTVGSIHGGTKHNIIPNDVRLQLTLRAFSPRGRRPDHQGDPSSARPRAWPTPTMPPPPTVTLTDENAANHQHPRPLSTSVLPMLTPKGRGRGSNVVAVEPTMGAEDFGLLCHGRRADLHVPPGHDPARPTGRRCEGPRARRYPSLHSALLPPRRPANDPQVGRQGDDFAAVVDLLPPKSSEEPGR